MARNNNSQQQPGAAEMQIIGTVGYSPFPAQSNDLNSSNQRMKISAQNSIGKVTPQPFDMPPLDVAGGAHGQQLGNPG